MKIKLGFIGLGLMGGAMVNRLLQENFKVNVWNRSREKIIPAINNGAIEASTVTELTERVDVILMCLLDSKAVEAVVFGEEGIAYGGSKDKVLVDLSSMRPDLTREFSKRLRSQTGMGWIDAPVSGGVKGAVAGSLAIMAGGEKSDIEHVRPIIKVLSQRFTHMGEVGAGQVTKLCNQIIVGSNIATIAEAISFAEKSGTVDAKKLAEALKGGWADSQPFQLMAPRFANRVTEPMIGASDTMLKDLETARDFALQNKASIPMATLASETLKKLSRLGLGARDISEIMTLFEDKIPEG
jgi:3-hydroxyisobutyrate dehydrogenase